MKFEPQCKKQSDLHREWARVLDMCEAARFDTPANCIKYDDVQWNADKYKPTFADGHTHYEFALAIVEGKPVFRGDVLFNNYLDKTVTILGRLADIHGRDCLCAGAGEFVTSSFSWNPPRRTITINGVEVKAPEPRVYDAHDTVTFGKPFIVIPYDFLADALAMKAALERKQP